MRVLIAPQEFKGTLTAREAADAIAAGLRRVLPDAELELLPLADGGPGTVEALVEATAGRYPGGSVIVSRKLAASRPWSRTRTGPVIHCQA